jgi:probable HAF family extracellular repeat protein
MRHHGKGSSLARLACLAALAFFGRAAEAGPFRYEVRDLGTLPDGGQFYRASDINASGQVVGSTGENPFLYSGGTLSKLEGGNGRGINDSGQVTRGMDRAINNSGQTVGEDIHVLPGGGIFSQGYITSGGITTYFGQGTAAFAINNVGQVAGMTAQGDGTYHPFLYSNGQLIDLGLLAGAHSATARAINDLGQVVGGGINDPYGSRAFFYSDGQLHDLGTLGGKSSDASDINRLGQIVGAADTDSLGNAHAFLYEGGSLLDLNDLIGPDTGWLLAAATGINDKGQIVGAGFRDGSMRAFMLTPAAVPEPSTIVMFGVCAVAGVLARRRSSRLG